jgi:hypothetical protein
MHRNLNQGHKILIMIALAIAIVGPISLAISSNNEKINAADKYRQDLDKIIKMVSSSPYDITKNIEQPDNIISIDSEGNVITIIYNKNNILFANERATLTLDYSPSSIFRQVDIEGFIKGAGTYELHAYITKENILKLDFRKNQ